VITTISLFSVTSVIIVVWTLRI